jgi:hypothetical protein
MSESGLQLCHHCGIEKDAALFTNNKWSKTCRECCNIDSRRRYAAKHGLTFTPGRRTDTSLEVPVGIVFGQWTVIGKTKNNHWLVRCRCGTEANVVIATLQNGHSKSCLPCAYKLRATTHKTEEKVLNALWQTAFRTKRSEAARRNLVFDLTFNQFQNLSMQNCSYCGIEPCKTKLPTASQLMFCPGLVLHYQGLDRINSERGYTLGNTLPCCPQCNTAKLDYAQSEFLEWARRLIKYQDDLLNEEAAERTMGICP